MDDVQHTGIELFSIDAAAGPCGIIITERNAGALRCSASFQEPDGESVLSRCLIETGHRVAQWSSFSFASGNQEFGTFRCTDVAIDADLDIVPGHGFSLYLIERRGTGARSAEFGWLDEFWGAELDVRSTRFDAVGEEDLDVPLRSGSLLGVDRVELPSVVSAPTRTGSSRTATLRRTGTTRAPTRSATP